MIFSCSLESGVQTPESKVKILESEVRILIQKSTKEKQSQQIKSKLNYLRRKLKIFWEKDMAVILVFVASLQESQNEADYNSKY